jgi:hypothetical protein
LPHRQLSLPIEQYSIFTYIWFVYRAADSVCMRLFDIQLVFDSLFINKLLVM